MKRNPYDLNRFHFLNWISESALVDLYRLSRCHFYWTVPFTLSWSLFQAMASGCAVVASNSLPVRDAIDSGENGFLIEPYDVDAFVERMLEMLDNPHHELRDNARQKMVENFSFDVCLPKLANFYLNSITDQTADETAVLLGVSS